MAKRSNPSSTDGSSDKEDVTTKKLCTTTKKKEIIHNVGSSSARSRDVSSLAASVDTINSIEPANTQHGKSSTESQTKSRVGNSFLNSQRLAKSQPSKASYTATKVKDELAATAAAATTSKSNNNDTQKINISAQMLNGNTSNSRRSGIFLSIFLFAINIASVAYIVSQHTIHNLAQMRCKSTVDKLEMELYITMDELKILRKAMESVEGGSQNMKLLLKDLEGMKGTTGSRTAIEDHKQFLVIKELDKWQQLVNELEEEMLLTMNDYNDKLKSLLL